MSYWQRVEVEDRTEDQTDTGAPVFTWSSHLSDVEARVLPLNVTERDEDWATPEEDAVEVQVRGADSTIRPRMRVVVGGAIYYEVRRVLQPAPFGTPTTILWCVKVTP